MYLSWLMASFAPCISKQNPIDPSVFLTGATGFNNAVGPCTGSIRVNGSR